MFLYLLSVTSFVHTNAKIYANRVYIRNETQEHRQQQQHTTTQPAHVPQTRFSHTQNIHKQSTKTKTQTHTNQKS